MDASELLKASPRRPGRPLAHWQMFEPRVLIKDGVAHEEGIRNPEGEYFEFSHGEKMSFDLEGGVRIPKVILGDGSKVTFDAWRASQRDHIREVLEKVNPLYGQMYTRLIQDYPELEHMDIVAGTKTDFPTLAYTGGFWQRPSTSHPNPSIVVNVEGNTHYETLMRERELSAQSAADMMGISFEELKRHPQVLATFIFLHEAGHVRDYILNYQKNPLRATNPNYDPIQANLETHSIQMTTLPMPGKSPQTVRTMYKSGDLKSYLRSHQERFRKMGINTVEELIATQERAYRHLPKEKYADEFAAQVIQKYWSVFGIVK